MNVCNCERIGIRAKSPFGIENVHFREKVTLNLFSRLFRRFLFIA